jgi:hypothetical protein
MISLMRNKISIIVGAIIVMVVAVIAVMLNVGGSMDKITGGRWADFELKNFTGDGGKACYWPKPALEERCRRVGGTLESKTVMVGLSTIDVFNCWPTRATADAGKRCQKDADCEGLCVWLGGDIVSEISARTCSSFGKPLFGEGVLPSPVCYDYYAGTGSDGNLPMAISEFDSRSSADRVGTQCLWPKPELVARCQAAGGRLTIDPLLAGIGNFNFESFGCYPKEAPPDAGKKCTFNSECLGERCVPVDSQVKSFVCTSLETPIFGASWQPEHYVICRDYLTGSEK